MGVLDRVVIVEEEGAVWGVNLGRPIVTNGDFVTLKSHDNKDILKRFLKTITLHCKLFVSLATVSGREQKERFI